MGQAMCGHILDAGFAVTVYNRTPRSDLNALFSTDLSKLLSACSYCDPV